VARPNAVAENNAIANTPASAVTVIGARARRSSVIPLVGVLLTPYPSSPKTTFSPKTTLPAVLRSHQFLAPVEVL